MTTEELMLADIEAQWALVRAQVSAKGAGTDLLPAGTQKLIETAFRLGYQYGARWAARQFKEAA